MLEVQRRSGDDRVTRRKGAGVEPSAAKAAPLLSCPACKGTGWARLAAAPNRTGADGRQVIYDPPLVRCECGNNRVMGFEPTATPQPTPQNIDRARKAAGERED